MVVIESSVQQTGRWLRPHLPTFVDALEPNPFERKALRIGETLSKELQEVLDDLDPSLPGAWQEAAKMLGYFIDSLEQVKE